MYDPLKERDKKIKRKDLFFSKMVLSFEQARRVGSVGARY
jgi:hypothetical protein